MTRGDHAIAKDYWSVLTLMGPPTPGAPGKKPPEEVGGLNWVEPSNTDRVWPKLRANAKPGGVFAVAVPGLVGLINALAVLKNP